jgi:hypothetical protein
VVVVVVVLGGVGGDESRNSDLTKNEVNNQGCRKNQSCGMWLASLQENIEKWYYLQKIKHHQIALLLQMAEGGTQIIQRGFCLNRE